MKTLKDLYDNVIADISNQEFSAHDVTMAIRAAVNSSTDSFMLKIIQLNGKHVYSIEHDEVKALIEKDFNDKKLQRRFNANYFLYSKPVAVVNAVQVVAPTQNAALIIEREIDRYVRGYIERNPNELPTLHMIQKAIWKRQRLRVDEIAHIVNSAKYLTFDRNAGCAMSDKTVKPVVPDTNNAQVSNSRREEIFDVLKSIISEQLGVSKDQVKEASRYIEDLGADSLDTVELVMAIEDRYEIEIYDGDAEKLLTVGETIDYLVESV